MQNTSAGAEQTAAGRSRGSFPRLRARTFVWSGVGVAGGIAAALLVLFLVVLDEDSASASLLEAQATRGDLVDGVSADGSIVLPERSLLSFDTAGTLAELNVSAGATVSAGDVLARLDSLTIADLAKAVEQARTELSDAQDSLVEAQSPAKARDLANAEMAVLTAREALTDAEEYLAALGSPSDDNLLAAGSAITDAEAKLEDAQEALADLQALPDAAAVAEAAADAQFAQESYDNAVADLGIAERDLAATVADSEDAADTARDEYAAAFGSWLGYALSEAELVMSPSAILTGAGIDLDAVFNSSGQSFRTASQIDDPSTPWDELTVFTWIWLQPQDVYGTCDSGVRSGTSCVAKELDDAYDALAAADAALASDRAKAASALSAARKSVNTAGNSLAAAQDALGEAQKPASALQLRQADEAVRMAEAAIRDAIEARDTLESPTEIDIAMAQSDVAIARPALDDTLADLDDLRAVGSDAQLIALRRAEAGSAAAVLASREDELASATIRSDVSGVVDAINFDVGDPVQRGAAVIEVVDRSVVTVVMDVDQLDILSVQQGAQAAVTVTALPGQTLTGIVSEIGAANIAGNGSVSFPVTITIEPPEGVDLSEGLSANAQVISSFRSDLLLVPAAAIGGTFTQPTVQVLHEGTITTVPVTLDGGNETYAVIDSGLTEGQMVVFTLPESSGQTNPFAVIRAGSGLGGFGGPNFEFRGGGGQGGGQRGQGGGGQ